MSGAEPANAALIVLLGKAVGFGFDRSAPSPRRRRLITCQATTPSTTPAPIALRPRMASVS